MNKYKSLPLFLALIIFVSACTSTTVIRSVPSGANLYINENYVGATPYTYSDAKITGAHTRIRLEIEGFEPMNSIISRTEKLQVGALIGGFFF